MANGFLPEVLVSSALSTDCVVRGWCLQVVQMHLFGRKGNREAIMSVDILVRLLLGHIVGDYFFQNDWMALNKKSRNLPCFMHVLVWTASVCVFIIPELSVVSVQSSLIFLLINFVTHFAIDRTYIVDSFLHLIRGKSYQRAQNSNNGSERTYAIAYTVLVQTVVDNAIHLTFLYLSAKLLLT